mmetsp:Transcript_24264/g.36845  ORF Transcript_24264/g.36845 Transcript_24264/m.36845 type:complete len:128 (+) Transcript_24264:442-825(+)
MRSILGVRGDAGDAVQTFFASVGEPTHVGEDVAVGDMGGLFHTFFPTMGFGNASSFFGVFKTGVLTGLFQTFVATMGFVNASLLGELKNGAVVSDDGFFHTLVFRPGSGLTPLRSSAGWIFFLIEPK